MTELSGISEEMQTTLSNLKNAEKELNVEKTKLKNTKKELDELYKKLAIIKKNKLQETNTSLQIKNLPKENLIYSQIKVLKAILSDLENKVNTNESTLKGTTIKLANAREAATEAVAAEEANGAVADNNGSYRNLLSLWTARAEKEAEAKAKA